MKIDLDKLRKSENIVELLDEVDVGRIGQQVIQGLDADENSRAEWKERVELATDIAKQTIEVKNTPWENASNIKFPLITKAAIDFAARLYPEIIQNDRVVKAAIFGQDPDNSKFARGSRIAEFMSVQLLYENPDWEDCVDKLLHILPVVGTVFFKVYYHSTYKMPVADLCYPNKLVVNYNVQSLKSARRITHLITLYKNDVVERIRRGLFSDIDLAAIVDGDGASPGDDDPPMTFAEQHCWLDLDDDGYQEPYIVTVHVASQKVVRIVARFGEIERKDGKIVCIHPEHYFVDFHMIRSSDGGFYSEGLGTLLYPLNDAINTLLNQLVDAGTLANMQGGFIGRGVRIRNGEFQVRMGEWKVLDSAAGTKLAENIYQLPTKEPSQTLFQLLELLIGVGKDMISAQEVLQGKGQTQNVSPNSVLALIEQGLKVFSAIHKRLYRSFKQSYVRIYELNSKYLSNDDYQRILDNPEANKKQDFDLTGMDILPVADPNMSTSSQRLAKAQALTMIPGLNPMAVTDYYLNALQLSPNEIQQLNPPPDPNAPPPPQVMEVLAHTELMKAQALLAQMQALDMQTRPIVEAKKVDNDTLDVQIRQMLAQAQVAQITNDAQIKQGTLQTQIAKETHKAQLSEAKVLVKDKHDMTREQLQAIQLRNKREKDMADVLLEQARIQQEGEKAQVELGIKAFSEDEKASSAKNKVKDEDRD